MTIENNDLPSDVAALQQMVQELRQQNKVLIEETESKNVTQQQQTAELARLYQQVTGGSLKDNWSLRDYALAIYQYLDNILALAPGNLYWLDKNSVLLGGNNTLAKLSNLPSRQSMVGKRNADLPWAEQAEVLEAANNHVMETGRTIILEETVDTPHGVRTFLSAKVPLRDEEGQIIGVLGTAMDITEQKQAIEALKHAKQQVEGANRARSEFLHHSREELDPLFENINKQINELLKLETDEDKRNKITIIFHKNEEIQKIFNFIVNYDDSLLDPESTFDFRKEIPAANTLLESVELQSVVGDKDETIYKLEQKCKDLQRISDRYLQENQQLRAVHQLESAEFAALYQQVTGQTPLARLALRDYALAIYEYLDNILALAPGSIYWLDRNCVFLGCNNAQAKMANLPSRQMIIGKVNAEMPWSSQAELYDKTYKQVMESGESLVLEEEGDTAQGFRWYLSQKVPLRDKQGNIIGLLGTSVDITEQKQAMIALADAKKKAEEASWAKSEFIQNMSHDLKTPLMTIMGMAEFLAETESDDERKEHLMMIHRGGKRMLEVFTSILDVASLEAGQVEIKHEPIQLREMIQGLFELYQPLTEQKGLVFKISVSENVPLMISNDPMRIQRILLNLIGNALKFTKEGGVMVKADVEEKSDNSQYLILSVADTGLGIPSDKLELIFEKFVRLTPSYEGKYTGTGLGLGIVKRFVEELGGSIKVESTEGKGTEFICSLPIRYDASYSGYPKC